MSAKHLAILITVVFFGVVTALFCVIPFAAYAHAIRRYNEAKEANFKGFPEGFQWYAPEPPSKKFYAKLWLLAMVIVTTVALITYW